MAHDFERIMDLLRQIQIANNKNTQNFDSLLSSINSKLEINANNSSDDKVKTYINELTNSIESKYSFTLSKIQDIEKALKIVYDNQNIQKQSPEILNKFDLLEKSINNFYNEAKQEKFIISNIETKINDLHNVKNDKDEVIRTISVLRQDFENLNLAYSHVIEEVNNNLKSLIAGIAKLDPIRSSEEIKNQINIIYQDVDDIMMKMKNIDSTNVTIENILKNTARNEELKVTKEIVQVLLQRTENLEKIVAKNKNLDDISSILTDNIASKQEFIELINKTEYLLNSSQEVKQILGKIALDVENTSDMELLKDRLLKIYDLLNLTLDTVEDLNIKESIFDIESKLTDFKSELETSKNIVTDLDDVIKTKIITQINSLPTEQQIIDIKKEILNEVSKLPAKENIERILQRVENLATQDDIEVLANTTEKISKQVASLNVDKEISRIYNKTDMLEQWLIDSKIKENSAEAALLLQTKAEQKDIVTVSKYTEQIIQKLEDLSRSSNFSNMNSAISDINEGIKEIKDLLINKPDADENGEIQSNITKIEETIKNLEKANKINFSEIMEKLNNFNINTEFKNEDNPKSSIIELEEIKKQIIELKNISKNEKTENSENIMSLISSKFDELSKDIDNIISNSKTEVQQGFVYNTQLLEEKTEQLLNFIKESSNPLDKQDSLSKDLEVLDNKLSGIKDELSLITTDIVENLSTQAKNIIEELNPVKQAISDMNFSNSISDLKTDITNLYEEIKKENDILTNQEEIDIEDSFRKVNNNITDLENNLKDFIVSDTDSILIKLDNLKNYLESAFDNLSLSDDIKELIEFKNDFNEFAQNQEQQIETSKIEILNEFAQKSEDLKSLLLPAINHDDIIKEIENLEQKFTEKFGYFDKFALDMDNLRNLTDLKSDFAKFANRIEELSGQNKTLSEIVDKMSTRFEYLAFSSENQNNSADNDSKKQGNNNDSFDKDSFLKVLDLFKKDLNEFQQTVSNNIAEIKEQTFVSSVNNDQLINKLNTSLAELVEAINSSIFSDLKAFLKENNINTFLESINDKIDKIDIVDKKLDIIASNDDITILEDISDTLNNDINTKIQEIYDKLELLSLNDTENIIKESSNQIENKISQTDFQITSMLDELNQKLDDAYNNDSNKETFEEIKDIISEQKSYIENLAPTEKIEAFKKCLDNLGDEINKLSTGALEKDQFKKSLKDMKESIMAAVVTIFDQVSFIEETEDIKDFVEERTDEINKNIAQITKQLQQISNADDFSEYTYSMQDIETDLAKLRLALKDIKDDRVENDTEVLTKITDKLHQITSSVDNLTQDEIKALKSEISELKDQTQFLIATSDKSLNALSNGDFEGIINGNLTEKVDNVTKLLEKSENSDSVIRQSLIYMGEWIDSASESINKISENSSEIETIAKMLEEFKTQQQKHLSEIEKNLEKFNEIDEKIEEQNSRINRLEMNLDKILSAIENLDDSTLTKKVEKIEKHLTKLSTNIEKLASYVD